MSRPAVVALAFFVGGCGFLPDWLGAREGPPLPGTRISALTTKSAIQPDPSISDVAVRLPPPVPIPEWPQSGGYANHAMHHIEVPGRLDPVWRANIGKGRSVDRRMLVTPVVAQGMVFTFDATGSVTAFDAVSGAFIWGYGMVPEAESSDAFGGGIAYGGGRLYVATGVGEVIALDAAQGGEYWRVSVGSPIHAPPTLSDGRLFVVTFDNQLFALDAGDGRELWSHRGFEEQSRLLGAASPAATSSLIVAAYSSGELVALRPDNGRVAWRDELAFGARLGALASLGDIQGNPVIDRDRVYAISHAGRLVAINLRTGDRLWDQEIGGVQTPWIAGDFLFVLGTDGDLLCLSRRDGRIRWVRVLPRYKNPEDREDPIFWSGPILVSNRLIVVGSHGVVYSVSPYSGRVLGQIALPGNIELPPVVAGDTVYVVTNDGELIALR